MKRFAILMSLLCLLLLAGCSHHREPADIAATTLPVYEFTAQLCQGTDLTVTQLVTESVSCLHDYTLKIDQMRAIEGARLVIINGAGLEEFMDDALSSAAAIADCSQGLSLLEGEHDEHGHTHADDPHIWLSPANAKVMAQNICDALCARFPEHTEQFTDNLNELLLQLNDLQSYGEEKLATLSCREIITFHDGFGYFAESFDLTIIRAVEEESGSEASAAELIELAEQVRHHDLTAIFTELNGSVSAAEIISAETGTNVYALDMSMSGDSYFTSMYHNIDTIWEALQ